MDTNIQRQRSKRKVIRVTFPDGKSFCYRNVTDTFIAVLQEIGAERFTEISLELCHLPLLSREIYPRFQDWMKPVCGGWYLNAQSNTDQKYIQLRSISESLKLDLKLEIGENLETDDPLPKSGKSRAKQNIVVKFPDGETITNQNALETYLASIRKIGLDTIMRKALEWGGLPVISNFRQSARQLPVAPNRWAAIPTTTKDKAKLLKAISSKLKLPLEVTIL